MALNTGNPLLDAIGGTPWIKDASNTSRSDGALILTVFFDNSTGDGAPTGGAWTQYEKDQFWKAMRTWSDVANIRFLEVDNAAAADLIERKEMAGVFDNPATAANEGSNVYGDHQNFPENAATTRGPLEGRYNTNIEWNSGGLAPGGLQFHTFVHELGHALGLEHPHQASEGTGIIPALPAGNTNPLGGNTLDTGLATIMSYNDQARVAAPMAIDIAAIQTMYGAVQKNAGDTVYTLNDGPSSFYQTIWDTGGVDTIRYDGAGNATIDLRSATLDNRTGGGGFLSSVEVLQPDGTLKRIDGGFTIAADVTDFVADVGTETGVIIENATGGSGNDRLVGNGVNNILRGGAGHDRLDGGGGADIMNGGLGSDTYVVDNISDQVVESFGSGGIDTVESMLTSYKLGASIENLTFTYRTSGGGLSSINAVGTGNALDNVMVGSTGHDTLDGGAGKDILYGGLNSDTLIGGIGDDTYVVDHAGDVVDEEIYRPSSFGLAALRPYRDAGSSNDTVVTTLTSYDLSNTASHNSEIYRATTSTSSTGLATSLNRFAFTSSVSTALASVAVNPNPVIIEAASPKPIYGIIENLLFTGVGDFTGTGNAANNIITGGAGNDTLSGLAGYDTLDGGSGSDRLEGGVGNDTLIGGDNFDTFVMRGAVADLGIDKIEGGSADGATDKFNDQIDFSGLAGRVTVDLTGGSFTATDGVATVTSSMHGVEFVVGTAFDDSISGDARDNELIGGGGKDTLRGGAGKDLIDGGEGNDLLQGGAGQDFMAGRSGVDTFVFDPGWGEDWVMDFANGSELLDMRLVSSLTSFDQLTISGLVQDGTQTARVTYGGDIIYLFGRTASEVTADDFWFSSQAAPFQRIVGDDGANMLIGTPGIDFMYGFGGDDTLVGLASADAMDGGTGVDTADYSGSLAGVTIDIAAGTGRGGDAEGDTLISIENALGSGRDDRLTGDSGSNILSGLAGSDTLIGGAGADVLLAGAGHDVLIIDNADTKIDGGDGYDYARADQSTNAVGLKFAVAGTSIEYVDGSAGADVITAAGTAQSDFIEVNGNAGADTMIDGAGEVWFDGGEGIDTMVFSGNLADYTIKPSIEGPGAWTGWTVITHNATGTLDWTIGVERLQFDDQTIDDPVANRYVTGAGANDALNGTDGADILVGGDGADELRAGASNDALYIDNFDTVVDGGDGWDVVYVSESANQSGLNFKMAGTNTEHVWSGLGNDVIDLRGLEQVDNLWYGVESHAGDDTVIAGDAAFFFYGGAGHDRLVLSGNRADYTFEIDLQHAHPSWPDLTYITRTSTGKFDEIASVETVEFADGTFAYSDLFS